MSTFGDTRSAQYASMLVRLLINGLAGFCKRTLRNQVTEYIRYTERRPITRPFVDLSTAEHALYGGLSGPFCNAKKATPCLGGSAISPP